MTDKRKHRGAHPDDEHLFAESVHDKLRSAVCDYSLLLGRGYAGKSSLKLVGDRFALTSRQRMAVMRCGCGDDVLSKRVSKQVKAENLSGESILLDGYNVITTIESAMAGGVILLARDGCFRDIAGMHGTYRKVDETIPAVKLIGQFLAEASVSFCQWYLDSPVSNSGRLRGLILEIADKSDWPWQVELVYSPDGILARATETIATADGEILNRCQRWHNLAREIIEKYISEANIVDLSR